jgi:hypothetical protein
MVFAKVVSHASGIRSDGFSRKAFWLLWGLLCVSCPFLFGSESTGEGKTLNPGDPGIHRTTPATEADKTKVAGPNGANNTRYAKKINFLYRPAQDEHLKTALNQQTPTPNGWESYDGSIYTPERGYGWLTDLRGYGRDRGIDGMVVLPDGTKTSPRELKRPELANFHSRHRENDPLVFRIDLPNGWYRVSCASVDPDKTPGKPLVDQRSFKCRAHDAIFAGASYGAPLAVGGRQLIEGSGIVEATDGHLRIVIGDPAYAGWTWRYAGPLYTELKHWWRAEYSYAESWYQWFTRMVDPGFHSMGLNSLKVERVSAPPTQVALVFRDFFNRDDSPDVNVGVPPAKRWVRVKLDPRVDDSIRAELRHTAMTFSGGNAGPIVGGFLQRQLSPAKGVVRYSTRVSLFTGEGSQKHSGAQEAGILLLAEPAAPDEFNATFVGVQFDSSRAETKGRLIYRVGDGRAGYRTNVEVPDTGLPFEIREGEFEIVVEHDVTKNVLRRMQINRVDITDLCSLSDRTQRFSRGLFGIRGAIHNTNPRVSLRQHYWYYRMEGLGISPGSVMNRRIANR